MLPLSCVLLLCGVVFFASSCLGGQGEQVLGEEAFKRMFTEMYTSRMVWPPEDLVIDRFAAKPVRLTVAEGVVSYRHDGQIHPEYLGKKSASVTILVDGAEAGVVRMTGDIVLYGDVVCTSAGLGKGKMIAPEDVMVVRRNISTLGSDLLEDVEKVVGKKLKNTLRAGVALKARDLEDPPLVQRGDIVTILAHSDTVRISVPGMARNSGARGERIRVKNLMSRKEVFAKVSDARTVEVEF